MLFASILVLVPAVLYAIKLNAGYQSYYNSLSLAFTEICGRSHGGGVLELMPNEVECIAIPYSKTHTDLLPEIDRRLREKQSIYEILKYTNQVILKETLGFSDSDIPINPASPGLTENHSFRSTDPVFPNT